MSWFVFVFGLSHLFKNSWCSASPVWFLPVVAAVVVLEAGAVGYIPKNIGIKAFYSAITLMAEGEIFLPADHGSHRSENSFLPNNWLTGREQDMLAGLLAGKSNKEIARQHGLSEVTVKHHPKSLRGKLGAKNRTHAVCRAIELGIVPE